MPGNESMVYKWFIIRERERMRMNGEYIWSCCRRASLSVIRLKKYEKNLGTFVYISI